ncbi:hypothetical protein C1A50_0771 [Paenibacillus polymyxa]|nr:hypothetical protein C1A50_0771 [Paenibacillus polymyxa]
MMLVYLGMIHLLNSPFVKAFYGCLVFLCLCIQVLKALKMLV